MSGVKGLSHVHGATPRKCVCDFGFVITASQQKGRSPAGTVQLVLCGLKNASREAPALRLDAAVHGHQGNTHPVVHAVDVGVKIYSVIWLWP
jgi:hypothetical protein